MNKNTSKLLTTKEAAEHFGWSVDLFRKYIRDYDLPYYGKGRNKRFDLRKVENKLESSGSIANLKQDPRRRPAPKFSKNNKYARMLGLADN